MEREEDGFGGPRPVKKASNPKDAFGIKKASISCVSAPVIMELGIAMQEGACKYGRHNYRVIGVRGSVYYDASMRHLMSWWEGEDLDPDSGLSHITKAIASLVVLRDAMIQGQLTDDRPPRSKPWLSDLNARSEALFNKYPDPVKPYTETDNSWVETAERLDETDNSWVETAERLDEADKSWVAWVDFQNTKTDAYLAAKTDKDSK